MPDKTSIHNQFNKSTFVNPNFIFNKIDFDENVIEQDFTCESLNERMSKISNIEFGRKSNLTERSKKVVDSIANFFEKNKGFDLSKTKHCMLKSWSGEGKTTIAIDFAYKFGSQFISSYWIDSSISIGDQFLAIAENQLGIVLPTEMPKDKVRQFKIDSVKKYINSRASLVIFDNIEKLEDCRNFLPKTGTSRCILITTNFNIKRPSLFEEIDIPKLSENDALRILLEDIEFQECEKEVANKIATIFEYSPFALELANNYLRDFTDISLSLFLDEIKQATIEWEGLYNSGGFNFIHTSPSIISLIERRIKKLNSDKKIDSLSSDLLSLLGSLYTAGLGFEFKKVKELLNIKEETFNNKKKLSLSKKRLEELGLVKTTTERFIVHTLTLEYLKNIYTKIGTLVEVLDFVFQEATQTRDMQLQFQRFLLNSHIKHAELLIEELERRNYPSQVPKIFAEYYMRLNNEYFFYKDWLPVLSKEYEYELSINKMVQYADKSYSLIENTQDENKNFILKQILFEKAISNHIANNTDKAAELYDEFLNDRTTIVPIPMLFNALLNRIKIHCLNKKFESAIKDIEFCLKYLEHFLEHKNIDEEQYLIYKFKANFAKGLVCHYQDEKDKAKKILDNCIEIAEAVRLNMPDSFSKHMSESKPIGHPGRYPLEIALELYSKGSLYPLSVSSILEPLLVGKAD